MNIHSSQKSSQKGFIKTIILIVIALAVLSYFGFDLKKMADSPLVKKNFSYAWQAVIYVWHTYLAVPVTWIWNTVIINFLWKSILLPGIERLPRGQ